MELRDVGMVYCLDIDGTLCTNTDGDYAKAVSYPDVIAEVNRLFAEGHRIFLYTARGSTTGIDWRELTERQLREWNVRYHALFMGKPSADVYIDDKAVNSLDWVRSGFQARVPPVKGTTEGGGMARPGRVVWWNGEFAPESEARISIYDSALMFGDMVFEMTRSFNKVQFKLREHLQRLFASMKAVRISIPLTIDQMEDAVYRTIAANELAFAGDDEHRVMIDVSRGLLSIYEGNVAGVMKGPNVIIADFPLRWTVTSMGPLFDTGINAVIPSQRAIPASLLDPKVKNRSRLHYMMANIDVSNYEGTNNWALLLDPDGSVAEGTGDNFFIVKDRVVITPEGRNILRGVSRAYVLEELASQLELRGVEKNIEPYDVVTADEAFMTGTPFCILPVTSLNRIPIGTGRVGPVTKALLDRWSANVGVDIVAQIKGWGRAQVPHTAAGPSPYEFKPRP